jgi:hypothetical protein
MLRDAASYKDGCIALIAVFLFILRVLLFADMSSVCNRLLRAALATVTTAV